MHGKTARGAINRRRQSDVAYVCASRQRPQQATLNARRRTDTGMAHMLACIYSTGGAYGCDRHCRRGPQQAIDDIMCDWEGVFRALEDARLHRLGLPADTRRHRPWRHWGFVGRQRLWDRPLHAGRRLIGNVKEDLVFTMHRRTAAGPHRRGNEDADETQTKTSVRRVAEKIKVSDDKTVLV